MPCCFLQLGFPSKPESQDSPPTFWGLCCRSQGSSLVRASFGIIEHSWTGPLEGEDVPLLYPMYTVPVESLLQMVEADGFVSEPSGWIQGIRQANIKKAIEVAWDLYVLLVLLCLASIKAPMTSVLPWL